MLTIRPARSQDVATITQIYNDAGVGTTASYALEPVSVENRVRWFEDLRAQEFPVLVLELDGDVVGYASYGPFRHLAGYAYTVEHSIYLDQEHRAIGGGRMLMNALIDYARQRGVHVMIGVIDASNAESIAFHRKLGFVESGRLPQVGRKFDRWLDVVLMTLQFPEP